MWYRILFKAMCGSMVEYEMVHAKATYASCCRAEWRLERKMIPTFFCFVGDQFVHILRNANEDLLFFCSEFFLFSSHFLLLLICEAQSKLCLL